MPETLTPSVQPLPQLQICENCDAPLDGLQRYCLNCGARSRYVGNPALDHLVSKRKPPRIAPKNEVSNKKDTVLGIPREALPLLIGGTSLALIFGILFGTVLGGGKNNSNDAALAAALARQPVQVAAAATAATGASTATAAVTVASDFTLDKGYTVQVATVPSTSDQAAVDTAKSTATSSGASDVGVINPADFTVTPAPADGAFVIFSGQFKNKGDATKALKKLKAKFPGATVVSVKKAASSDGTVIAKGSNGKTALSLKTYKPSAKKVASDKKAVDNLNNKTGKAYRDAQENLPAQVTIPADPNAGSGPTGAGN